MENAELDRMLHTLLFEGKMIVFSSDSAAINLAMMFGFVKKQQNTVMIANRIFETRLYNMYLSDEEMRKSRIYTASVQEKNQFIVNGRLDMRRILEKFAIHFNDLYGNRDETFVEEEGRKYFLLYLRPIINGTGNYPESVNLTSNKKRIKLSGKIRNKIPHSCMAIPAILKKRHQSISPCLYRSSGGRYFVVGCPKV